MEKLLSGRENVYSSTSARHKNLFEAAARDFSAEELSAAMRTGFERAFSCVFVAGELSQSELALAENLREKYFVQTESI
jgi:lipoate-protein ligase A